MEKSTKIGIIAGAIAVIYIVVATILAVCGVISCTASVILIFAPPLGIGIFTLVFILVKFIMDFGGGFR